jgi:putative endopeptidase
VNAKHLLMGAAATAAVLSLAGFAAAASPNPGESCLDRYCGKVSLFGIAADATSGPSGSDSIVAPHYGTWGFDPAGMDASIKPGDNFYLYANGKALAALEIPSDRPRFGSFDLLRQLSDNRLRALVTGYAARTDLAPTSDEGKISAIYNSYMDEAKIEALDAKPIALDLAAVRALKTHEQVAQSMGRSVGDFGDTFFQIAVQADQKNPDKNVLYLGQNGLGLPDRDYYLKEDFKKQREAYETYVGATLEKVGWTDPKGSAKAILALETRIAEVSWSTIEDRDADKTYNRMTVTELEAMAPGFEWKAFLGAAGASKVTTVVVAEKTAFPKIAKIFAETPVETLRAWQAYHGTDGAAPLLSKRFADANFDFHGKTLQGTPAQRPRWKRSIGFTERTMGEALGRAYVAQYFPPESKAKMIQLIADLRTAMHARIEHLEWMGPDTKKKALEKLDKFTVKVGYPDHWRDYSGLKVVQGDLYGNAKRSGAFEWAYFLAKLDKPVDRTEWGMTPQTVNAYYNPTGNEIVFPAAILQAPFFDPNADMAVNYGGIGGVIGHEMGHGFDDQGRKSDGDGRLTEWWTAEDAAKFQIQVDKLGKQYDAFEILPGVHVQGGLTMGENIGDLNGSTLALDAYHTSLKGQPSPVLDGFTGDQRVYLGWAQVWREKARDDYYRQLVTTNPHAPSPFRAIGPLRNEDGWYAAFDIKPGDKYYVAPADRVRMW